MESIDRNNNGVDPFDDNRRYVVSIDLPSRIQSINGAWNGYRSSEPQNEAFAKAVEIIRHEFAEFVTRAFVTWWPARVEISKALNATKHYQSDGYIVVLGRYCLTTRIYKNSRRKVPSLVLHGWCSMRMCIRTLGG